MVMRRVSALGSTSFHDVANCDMPDGQFRYASQGLDDQFRHSSFNGNNLANSPKTYAPTPASTAADIGFSPWLTYDSPLSRTSSLSGSEHYSTPPPYVETPMYTATNQILHPSADYIMRDARYNHSQDLAWELQHGGGGPVLQQPPSVPVWHEGSYGGLSLPPTDYYAQPYMNDKESTPVQTVTDLHLYRPASTVDGGSHADDVLSESDSEDDDSDYDNGQPNNSQRQGPRNTSSAAVLRLGRWSHGSDCVSQPPHRPYICRFAAKGGIIGEGCKQSFARPEHLRRHERTVHSAARPYPCRVPGCCGAFSRGDNLRDHYWTHIHRGGRAGKNDKMSIEDLKGILGPREKKLIRKLKQKLSEAKMKMRAKP